MQKEAFTADSEREAPGGDLRGQALGLSPPWGRQHGVRQGLLLGRRGEPEEHEGSRKATGEVFSVNLCSQMTTRQGAVQHGVRRSRVRAERGEFQDYPSILKKW